MDGVNATYTMDVLQGPLRKSVAKALRKCVEDGPNTPRDRKKRLRTPEAGPGGNHSNPPHQHSPREESSGRQRKKGRGRDRDGPDKSDHEVFYGRKAFYL